jgi:hypothetical protein
MEFNINLFINFYFWYKLKITIMLNNLALSFARIVNIMKIKQY